MSLMLSRHGIWYYRKVNVLPCGKRREFRRSLGTRSKIEALKRVERFADRPWSAIHASPIALIAPTIRQNLPGLGELQFQAEQYVIFKRKEVGERETESIRRCLNSYFKFTVQPTSKSQASAFITGLDLSVSTKNKYVKKISGFFRWLSNRVDYEVRNPFEGLMQKDREPVASKRESYSASQVKRLIASLQQVPEWKRWIILLGRFTGMRANEICQLYYGDIKQIEGIWCVVVDDFREGQSVKTDNSKRRVPLHQELIAQGFLEYAERNEGRLFPQLTFYKGSYSHYFTRWFSRFRKRINVPEFHSLRHYVATAFKNAGVAEQFAGAFLGHSNSSITYNRYGKSVGLAEIYGLLEYLDD
ncbi:site-specific integrase [Escherichia coli]|uniref:site-specific integrase n=1 Tax=Escherichia coli TaxID=562 RepID=UPI00097223A7|nr:site-specific integrase [Escherichia coli]EEV5818323.1 site-specific integrase [Escherichia coli]EJH5706554.1 site-specific integrase [Escherichia coli]MCH6973688.1 site-specific integrase [Escherichia coli]MCH7099947.1 site-specific integrase [Escherichia coli]OMI47236.1 integrase [Escherichia coli N37122PS]